MGDVQKFQDDSPDGYNEHLTYNAEGAKVSSDGIKTQDRQDVVAEAA